jgi:hypothetical protein
MSHGARALPAIFIVLLAMASQSAGATPKPVPPKYKLIYAGSGSYAVDHLSPEGQRGHVGADFHWRIVYRAAPLRNGIIEWRRGNASGSGGWSMSSGADNCSRSGGLQLKGDGGGLVDLQHGVMETIVFPEEGDFSSTDPGGAGGPCDTADFWSQWVTGFSQIGVADAVDPLTSDFELPRRRLKQGKVISVKTSNLTPTFPSLVPSPSCGFSEVGECTQAFSWHATVSIRPVR